MEIKDFIRRHLLNKSIIIDLKEENAFWARDDFVYPNNQILCDAIKRYAVDMGEPIEIIQKENPIIFSLDGEKYKATLARRRYTDYEIFGYGYFIRCTNVID